MSNPTTELPRRTRRTVPSPTGEPPTEADEPAPVGTLFLMMLFLAAIVGLWGTIYWMLLTR